MTYLLKIFISTNSYQNNIPNIANRRIANIDECMVSVSALSLCFSLAINTTLLTLTFRIQEFIGPTYVITCSSDVLHDV